MRVKREPQIILYGWGMVIRDELSETVWHFPAPSAVGDMIEQKLQGWLKYYPNGKGTGTSNGGKNSNKWMR